MMSIVKIPKKIRDISDTLRSGQIEEGLDRLEKIAGFEPQKAIIKAEISYFKNDYEMAMHFDEQALPFNDQWYAGNILTEHLFAYSNAAIASNTIDRAENFLHSYLMQKESAALPEHQLNFYKHQITQHLKKLKGEKNLIIDAKPLALITNGKKQEEFVSQLKEYRPGTEYETTDGADYLLHFMFYSGNTENALEYYSRYSNELRNEHHHIDASRLFLQTNRIEDAKNAIRMYAAKAWYPVEYIQIAPMQLFAFEELFPILTPELKEELLFMPKAVR